LDRADFLERRFIKDPSMVFRKIADECLLVPIRQNVADMESIYVLNEVGGRIWELVDGQKTVQGIRDVIVSEFDVSPQQAEADVREFVQKLSDIGGVKTV
jgi:hypothetical protein